jgi:hypothetical protein
MLNTKQFLVLLITVISFKLEGKEGFECPPLAGEIPTSYNNGGGDGSENTPFLIYNEEQIKSIAAESYIPSHYFKQCNDISLASSADQPYFIEKFYGHYDGNNKVLSDYTNFDGPGLIHKLRGSIKNLKISNFIVNSISYDYAGALVGRTEGYTLPLLSNIHVKDSRITNFIPGGGYAGGVIGQLYAPPSYPSNLIDSSVDNTYIESNATCGGAIGFSWNSNLTSTLLNSATVRCPVAGGAIGRTADAHLSNVSVKDGVVESSTTTGGLVALASDSTIVKITVVDTHLHISGDQAGHAKAGGIAGWASDSLIYQAGFKGKIEVSFKVAGSCLAAAGVGGIVGYSNAGTSSIVESFSDASIITKNQYNGHVGGAIGYWSNSGPIVNSYAKTIFEVDGSSVGGLIGYIKLKSAEDNGIKNTYAQAKFKNGSTTQRVATFLAYANLTNIQNPVAEDLGENTFALLDGGLFNAVLPPSVSLPAKYAGHSNTNSPLEANSQFYEKTIKCNQQNNCANNFGIPKKRLTLLNPQSHPLSEWDFVTVWKQDANTKLPYLPNAKSDL